MIRYLTNEKRCSTEQLIDDGLLKIDTNTGEVKNTFRNRVLVPICDEYGRVVGFGGRVLDDRKPKYLNTSENEIFHKSKILFNYHQAKTFAKNNELVIVEGYFDVISSYSVLQMYHLIVKKFSLHLLHLALYFSVLYFLPLLYLSFFHPD